VIVGDVRMTKKIIFQGREFSSLKALAAEFQVNYGNVVRRVRTGWTLEQALDIEPAPRRTAHNSVILKTTKGNFTSIRAASEAYGIQEGTLAKRLRDGWSVSEAVGDVKKQIRHPNRGNTVICDGKSYDSIWALADAFNVNRKRTSKRLRSGWSPEQAVGLQAAPPRFRNQDGSARDHAWTGKILTSTGETVPVSAIGSYSLYLIKDKKQKTEYVGITTGDIKRRLRGHWNMVHRGRHSKLYNAMRKAEAEGRKDDFEISLLRDDAQSFEELQVQEQEEIAKRDAINCGLNTAQGGSLGTPNPIVVDGEQFISQQAAAEYFGIDPHNFNQRMSKLGWTPEQAAGLDDSKVYGIEVNIGGVTYNSINSACSELGKSYKKVIARISDYNWSIEQAFDLAPPPPPKKPSNSTQLSTSIGDFQSIADAAQATGIKMGTIANRLRSGWTPDQAVGAAPKPNKNNTGQAITIEGKRYSSLADAARSHGLEPKIVHQRMKRGKSLKQALEIDQ